MRQTIFLVAPGPGVTAYGDLEPLLRGRGRVIAIKWGFLAVPNLTEVLWSTHAVKFYRHQDVIDYRARRPDVRCFTMRSEREGGGSDGVATLENAQEYGLCKTPGSIAFGKNSGTSGLNIAWHELKEPRRGSRIILLGYDMRQVDGRSHFHREQPTTPEWQYRNIFSVSFVDIAADLEAEGVSVVNCTPGSALQVFPQADLRDVLKA